MTELCPRCSSRSITSVYLAKEGRELDKCVCVDCSYVWYNDNAPPVMPKPALVMDAARLAEENGALRSIIDNQARVIADYQEMMRTL